MKQTIANLIAEVEKEIKNNKSFEHLEEEMKEGFDSFYNQHISKEVSDYWAVAIAMHLKDYDVLKAKKKALKQAQQIQDGQVEALKKEVNSKFIGKNTFNKIVNKTFGVKE